MRPFLGFPELWNDGLHSRKNKKKDPFCPIKKKKPVVVSDILFHRPALRRPASFAAPVGSRFFNCPSTALYCLHAARSGYSGRLDCNKKGNIYLSGGKQESEATLEMCDASLCLVSSQAMASLGPHRGKADGSYRTRTFPVLRFVKSSCVSMCSFISPPQPKRNDTTTSHGLKTDDFSMTASGTAGGKPSVSTGRTSFPPGLFAEGWALWEFPHSLSCVVLKKKKKKHGISRLRF